MNREPFDFDNLDNYSYFLSTRVPSIVTEHLEKVVSYITPLREICDAWDMMELIMAFENEFDVETSDEEADAIETVADVVKLIRCKLSDDDLQAYVNNWSKDQIRRAGERKAEEAKERHEEEDRADSDAESESEAAGPDARPSGPFEGLAPEDMTEDEAEAMAELQKLLESEKASDPKAFEDIFMKLINK